MDVLHILQQIVFVVALGITAWLMTRRIQTIKKTIQLGKADDRTDRPNERLATMLRVAFGQKKMFDRPAVGFLHFIIYAGFILINLDTIELVLDGIFGTHRILSSSLGVFYGYLINFFEVVALSVIVVCVVFLIRRNITKVPRLQATRHREMNGFPVIDANIILIAEATMMTALLVMNASDSILQKRNAIGYTQVGSFFLSSFISPLFENFFNNTLIVIERLGWWFHILGIFAFSIYVTYSKHLHIFLAFPNTYFANLTPKGKMQNMPEITKEVKIMLGLEQPDTTEPPAEIGRFGAKDVTDLSWKNLMDAYSCTECGRCTSACPANITGKLLSPRKIMMDTRDRLEDIGRTMQANGGEWKDDGKTLLGDYIKEEEILACTSCNACVQECPVLINPLDIILQLRRYKIMDEAQAPASWNMMFNNLETNQAPWKFSPSDRFKWAED